MADANQAAEELARTLQQINNELATHGRISQQTLDQRTDAEMKAKHGVENFTAGTKKGADAISALASAGLAAGKAMLDGKKGAAAFNDSLDQLSTAATAAGAALALMVPGGLLIKGLIAGLTAATAGLIKYTQAANEMADKLYTGFQGLAKSGAAASDGMSGVFEGAKKLGLSMNELGDYVQIVAQNSRDLANLGGSVYKGRQALENMGKAMEPAREAMLKMGLMPKDITEGMAGYLRTQTRLGYAQKMTVDQLAEGARKYLVEQDALTKLTGVQRSEREKAREEAMMEEQHAGVIRELQMQGERGKLEADRVQKISDIANDFSPAIAKMVRSLQSGVITDEGAKLLQSAPNAMRDLMLAQKGQISELEAIKRIFGAVGESGDRFRASLAKLSANDDTFVSMGETTKARIVAEKLQTMTLEQIAEEQKKQGVKGGKAADDMLDKQAKLIDTQIRANDAMERFIKQGISAAQDGMIAVANASRAAAEALYGLVKSRELSAEEKKANEAVVETKSARDKAFEGSNIMQRLFGIGMTEDQKKAQEAYQRALDERRGLEQDRLERETGSRGQAGEGTIPGAAKGGFLKGPESGYLAMLHGNELVIPEDKLLGRVETGGMAGAGGEQLDKMNALYNEMLKDTIELTRLTDQDLNKTKNFSRLSDRLRNLKTPLMIDEIELLEEQKDQLTKMLDAVEKSMGKDAASNLRKSITMQRAMSGGQGLQMPSAAGMPSLGGAGGLQVASQDDLRKLGLNIKAGDVQAENAKISPKLIELAKAIQSGVPGFGYFSSFNDKFHNEKAPSSMHTQGLAVDFTVAQPPSIEDGRAITSWLKQMGASVAIDEYNSPTAKATGGHFHAQLPAFEDGGELGAGKLGIAGEAGKPELITGPAEITPINDLMKAFGSLAGMMSQSVDKLDELVRAQKTNNDISSKMLRMQQ